MRIWLGWDCVEALGLDSSTIENTRCGGILLYSVLDREEQEGQKVRVICFLS